MKILRTLCLCFCLALLLWSGAYAQSVTISRDTEMRAEPNTASAVISTVKRDDKAVITAKQGPWLRVKLDAREGWLLTTSVLYGQNNDMRIGSPATTTLGIRNGHPVAHTAKQRGEEQLKLLDEYARQYDEELARANASD